MVVKIIKRYLVLAIVLISHRVMAAPFLVTVSQLDFGQTLPIAGSCEMDYLTGAITPLSGSQMCLPTTEGTIAHYRIISAPNTDINITVYRRYSENLDGVTFIPIGKLTSDVDDFDIVTGQLFTVNSGSSGVIDIKYGGQFTLANEFTPNNQHTVLIDPGLVWEEAP